MKREGRSRGLLAGREEEEDEEEEEDLPASSSGLGLRRRERCASGEEVLLPFTMAGSLFGRLSLEEGDSANSLEVLEMKLGVEGKNQKSPLDQFSRARSFTTVVPVEIEGDLFSNYSYCKGLRVHVDVGVLTVPGRSSVQGCLKQPSVGRHQSAGGLRETLRRAACIFSIDHQGRVRTHSMGPEEPYSTASP